MEKPPHASNVSLDAPPSGQFLTSFQRKLLVKSLQTDLRPEHRQRIEIMLLADQGQSQTQICKALGCAQETARYWIAIAKTGQAHQWNAHTTGRPKVVNEQYRDRLRELVSSSPRDQGYPFQRWTAHWLGKHLAKELGIQVSDRYINYLLKEMGLSTRSQQSQPQREESEPPQSKVTIRDLPISAPMPINLPLHLF